MDKKGGVVLVMIIIGIVLVISIFVVLGLMISGSGEEDDLSNSDNSVTIPSEDSSEDSPEDSLPDFPPSPEVLCENNLGYEVIENAAGNKILSVDSFQKLRETDYDFSQIADLNCLEYFDLEWESVSSTEGLEELNFLKYLNLAWTEVPEQECRDLAVILSETEVLCYHDTQGF